jgi:hypothetical protein
VSVASRDGRLLSRQAGEAAAGTQTCLDFPDATVALLHESDHTSIPPLTVNGFAVRFAPRRGPQAGWLPVAHGRSFVQLWITHPTLNSACLGLWKCPSSCHDTFRARFAPLPLPRGPAGSS